VMFFRTKKILWFLMFAAGCGVWYLIVMPTTTGPRELDLTSPLALNSITNYRFNDGKLLIDFNNQDAHFRIPFDNVVRDYRLKIHLGEANGIRAISIYHVLEGKAASEDYRTTHAISNNQKEVIVPLEDGHYKQIRFDLDLQANVDQGSVEIRGVSFSPRPITEITAINWLILYIAFLIAMAILFSLPSRLRWPAVVSSIILIAGLISFAATGRILIDQEIPLQQRLKNGLNLAIKFPALLLEDFTNGIGEVVSFQEPISGLPTLNIQLAPQALSKLRRKRDEAVESRFGVLVVEADDEVPGLLFLNDEPDPVNIRLRLKGDWIDHLKGNKWSFRIKIRGGRTVLGMSRFSLQANRTRGGHGEALLLRHLREEGLLAPRYKFVHLSVDNRYIGVMALEEHFTKELMESQNRRESVIMAFDESYLWRERSAEYDDVIRTHYTYPIKVFDENDVWESNILRGHLREALGLLRGYFEGWIDAQDVFNMKLYGRSLAILNLWNVSHGLLEENLRFYYNPINRLFEPIAFDNHLQREIGKTEFHNPSILKLKSSQQFISSYKETFIELRTQLQSGTLENRIRRWEKEFLQVLQRDETVFQFPIELLQERVVLLGDHSFEQTHDKRPAPSDPPKLPENPLVAMPAHVFWVEEDDSSYLEIQNLTDKNLYLDSIQYVENGLIERVPVRPDQNVISPDILGLGIEKRSRISVPHKPSVDRGQFVLKIRLNNDNVYAINSQRYFPPVHEPRYIGDLIGTFLQKHPYIYKKGQHQFYVKDGLWNIEQDILVPDGFSLAIPNGTTLKFAKDRRLVVRGALAISGTKEQPTLLIPQDETWGGVVVLNAERQSIIDNGRIEGIQHPDNDHWGLTGAVTFFQSDVEIHNSEISNIKTEDALNVIDSELLFVDSSVRDAISDGIDIDFGRGSLENSQFSQFGGDAIDISGSRINASDLIISGARDKGISVGERSVFEGNRLEIERTGIAIASKDGSSAFVRDIRIDKIQNYAFMAYIKKPEYGASKLVVERASISTGRLTAFALSPSRIRIDGTEISPIDSRIARLYGVDF